MDQNPKMTHAGASDKLASCIPAPVLGMHVKLSSAVAMTSESSSPLPANDAPHRPATAMAGETLFFTSKALPADSAFETYRQLCPPFSKLIREPGDFFAQVTAVRLGDLVLFDRELNGISNLRDEAACQDGVTHFFLHLVVAGRMETWDGRRSFSALPGDMVLVDTLKPSLLTAVGLRVLTVCVPRPILASAAGAPERLHCHVVGAPTTLFLADVLQSLIWHAGRIPARMLPGLRRAFAEALYATLVDVRSATADSYCEDLVLREAAMQFIDDHLSDRSLDAAAISASVGRSRSALYRIFQPYGGVAEYVMIRRVAAVRDAMDTGSTAPLAVLASQFGFTDESHLNRRFSRIYGLPVGAYRQAISGDAPDSVAALARRVWEWMKTRS